jgi:F-type H+-transporting ATPase subunit delta
MSQATTLARPYARALFQAAKQDGRLKEASEALAFSAQASGIPSVAVLLDDPRVLPSQLIDLLSHPDANEAMRRFLETLAENGRLALLPEVAALFELLRAESEHVVKAAITSATPLTDAELKPLIAALQKRFGSEVEVSTAVDPELIGGAVVDAGDIVIDGSVRNKLARMQASLVN